MRLFPPHHLQPRGGRLLPCIVVVCFVEVSMRWICFDGRVGLDFPLRIWSADGFAFTHGVKTLTPLFRFVPF